MRREPLIVVTGAAGMIGSGVVRHLNNLGKGNLLLVDDLKETDKWKNLVGKQFVDLISKHKIFEWLEGKEEEVDAFIHLGACSDTMERNGDYLMENNFRFTLRLADWAVKRNKRFIYASSAATYGDGKQGFSDNEADLEKLRPINMYAFSKHLADLHFKREGLLKKVVGLKYFNVFGPNEYHKMHMASMVLKMTHKANTEGVIHLFKSNDSQFSDGGQMRDFIYLKDAVRLTCAFLDPQYRNITGIYNIGRGQTTTWNELADNLFKALNKRANIQYIDMPSELCRQYQNYTCAEMSKLAQVMPLRFLPTEDSVREYVQEYLLDNHRW